MAIELRNGGMAEWQNGGNGGNGENGGWNGQMAGTEWLNGRNGHIHTIHGTHR